MIPLHYIKILKDVITMNSTKACGKTNQYRNFIAKLLPLTTLPFISKAFQRREHNLGEGNRLHIQEH